MRHSLPTLVSVMTLAAAAMTVVPGPAAAQVAQPTTATFSYVGGPQSFTVPDDVTEVKIVACGAQGGDDGGTYPRSVGGLGGEATATIAVTAGEVLTVEVGGRGAAGGYNGGGSGYRFGGGASDVRQGGTGLANRVVIGGGGGGGAFGGIDGVPDSFIGLAGGGGGGLVGGEGEGRDDRFGGVQGRGGTATAGGVGGRGSWDVGTSGTLGQGGQGPGGGGGGGGLFGGGGGGFTLEMATTGYAGLRAGGGGGSGLGDSFLPASCAGSGVVMISYTPAPLVPVVIPGSTTVVEGGSGAVLAQVPVSLSNASPVPVTIDWVTVDHAATAAADYVAASGTVTFAPGDTDAVVPVMINGDLLHEDDETLLVSFRNPTNATIGGFYGLGAVTIIDDDPEPVAVPLIGFVFEGDAGTRTIDVRVVLSAPSGLPVALDWTTYDVTATSPDDYESASGTLVIDAGATTGVVTIVVNGDRADEPVEVFLIGFTNPRGAVLGGFYGLGLGVVIDDD